MPDSQPLLKQKAKGLLLKKWTKLLMTMLHGLVELYRGQCITMCSCIYSSAWPQGQLRGELGKNCCWYLSMGAWPVVMWVK